MSCLSRFYIREPHSTNETNRVHNTCVRRDSTWSQKLTALTICVSGLLIVQLIVQPVPVQADIVYTYVGNLFNDIDDWTPPVGSYDTSMSVTGSFTMASALAPNLSNQGILPNTFSFSDGRNLLTHTTSLSSESFVVSTNSLGDIVEWFIFLETALAIDPIRSIFTTNNLSIFPDIVDQGGIAPHGGNADTGRVFNNPGVWSVHVIPEPGCSLLLMGMSAFLLSRRRVRV